MSELGADDLVRLLQPALAAFAGTVSILAGLLRWNPRSHLDLPNSRSLHRHAVPRVGGLGVIPAAAAAWLLLRDFPGPLASVALFLAAVSYFDDRRHLPIGLRLSCHVLAALAWMLLVSVRSDLPLAALLVLALVWMTNLYNFMDGADGLAGGMAVFGFGAYGAAALCAADPGLAGMCFALVGAALGFLLFNFSPARLFLGDAGSVPLGFLAGAIGLHGWDAGIWPAWFPLLVFSPFVVDASVTLARRVLRGDRFWEAHREHYYQRLVRMGWSHRKTALAEYGVMGAAAAASLALRDAAPAGQLAGLLACCGLYVAAMIVVDLQWRRYELGARQ